MKIWVTEIGEPLPLEKDVRMHRYGEFTKALSKMGHEVTWWSSSFSHAPKKFFATEDSDISYEGVKLKLIHGPGYKRNVSLQRIRHQSHFAKRFYELAHKEDRPDVIISPVPTLEGASAAVKFGKENCIPVLTDIRDHWPDEFADLAPSPLRPLARLVLTPMYKKMRYICENVTGIMGITKAEVGYGLKFSGREFGVSDHIFPLGYPLPAAIPQDKKEEARLWFDDLGVDSKAFIVCFFGTIGRYFDLDTVMKAAKRMQDENHNIQFVLAGAGSSLEDYKRTAQSMGLKNVFFPGWIVRHQIQHVIDIAKVGLAPYMKDAKMSMPNKPFEYMCGGLALASSIQGELKDVIANEKIGFTYTADDVDALYTGLLDLYKDSSKVEKMRSQAKQFFLRNYSTDKIFKEAEQHLESIVRGYK